MCVCVCVFVCVFVCVCVCCDLLGEHRGKLKAVYPEKNFAAFSCLLGEAWRSLDTHIRDLYTIRATADKERFRKQKETFCRDVRPLLPDVSEAKSKKKKHPLAPKHPLTAYLYYVATNRASLNAQHPDKSFSEIARVLGQNWCVSRVTHVSSQSGGSCALASLRSGNRPEDGIPFV